MEETKYYTPAPEDIRAGFEFESYNDFIEPYTWCKEVIGTDDVEDISHFLWQFKNYPNKVRVPYLAAEQIEAEGWKVTSSSESGRQFEAHLIRDQKIKLYTYNGPANQLIVYHSQTMVFRGICRCINDLRTVCKLLGI